MIARLRKTVEAIGEHGLILYVRGVGYGVTCSSATLQALEGHTQEVDREQVHFALTQLDIDVLGLDAVDRRYCCILQPIFLEGLLALKLWRQH